MNEREEKSESSKWEVSDDTTIAKKERETEDGRKMLCEYWRGILTH